MLLYPTKRGFTLIEMLISVTVMLLVVGGGIAAFLNFNDAQNLQGEGKELVSILRAAQSKARVGDRPDGCTGLSGYAVRGTAQGTGVQMYAICEGGDFLREEYQFEGDVVLDNSFDITFQSLQGGVIGADTISLTSASQEEPYEIEVNVGGEIKDRTLE